MTGKASVTHGATSYAEIVPLDPEWLWEGRIPLNWLTIVAGDGGIGKGRLIARLVSDVTNGRNMPDGTPGVPRGSVILVTVEDDPSMTMAHRLRAEGADLSKVYDMTTDDFIIPDSLPALRETIDAIGDVRMIILDPLSAVSSIPITSGNVRIRRKLMMPLERLARDTGIALVAVHHTVKSGRTAGAKAITDTARMVLRIARSPADDRVRVISVEKSNNSSDDIPDVAYTITGDPPVIRWVGMPDTGNTGRPEPSTAERILALLDAGNSDNKGIEYGEGDSLEVQEVARALHVAVGTVRVALTRLKSAGEVYSPARGRWALKPKATLVDINAAR